MASFPIFVDTNLDTHFAMDISIDETIADLKRKVMVEHLLCFPDIGGITISAAKVRRKSFYYHLSDSMCIRSAFSGIKGTWHIHIDAASTCLRENQATSEENLLGSENGRLEVPHTVELQSINILADIARCAQNDVLICCPSEEQAQPDSGTVLLDHFDKSILHQGPFNQTLSLPDVLHQHVIENSHTQNKKVPTDSLLSADPNKEASGNPKAPDPKPGLGASGSNIGERSELEVLKRHNRGSERSEALESSHDNVRDKELGCSSLDPPPAFVSPKKGDSTKKRDLEIDGNLLESLQPVALVQKRQKREREKEDSLPPEKDIFDDATAIAHTKEVSELGYLNSKEISSKPLYNDYPSSQNRVERRKKKSSKQQDGLDFETTSKTGLSTEPLPPVDGSGGVAASEKTITGGDVTSTNATVVFCQATKSRDHLKSGASKDASTHTSETAVTAGDPNKIDMNTLENKMDTSGRKVTFEEKKAKKSRRQRANSSKSLSVVSSVENGNVTGDAMPLEMLNEAVVRDTHNVTDLQHKNLTITDENVNKKVAADAVGSLMANVPNEIAGGKMVAEMDVLMPLVVSADKKAKPKQHRGVSSRGVNPPSVEEHGNILKDATTSSYIGNSDINIRELEETRKEINFPSKSKELRTTNLDANCSNYSVGLEKAEKHKDGPDSLGLTDVAKVTEFEEAKVGRGKKSKKARASSTRGHANDDTTVASGIDFNTEDHSYATKEASISVQAEKVTNQQTENSHSQLPCLEEGAVGEVNSMNTDTASGVETTGFRVEKGRRKSKRTLTYADASEPLTNQHNNKAEHPATSIQEELEETSETQNQSIEKKHEKTAEVQNQNTDKELEETGEVQNKSVENMKQKKFSPRKKKKEKSRNTDSKDLVSGSMTEGESNIAIKTAVSERILSNIIEHNIEGKHRNSNGRLEISVRDSSMNETNISKSLHLGTSIMGEHDATVEVPNQNMEYMKQEKVSPRKKKKLKSGKTSSKVQVSGSMTEEENDVGIKTAGSVPILPKIVEHDVGGKHQSSTGMGEISVMNSSMNEVNEGGIDFKKYFVPLEKHRQIAVDPSAKKSLKERLNEVARKPDFQSEDTFSLGASSNLLDPPQNGMKILDGNVGNIESDAPLSRNDEEKNASPPKRRKSSGTKVNNAPGNSILVDFPADSSKGNGTYRAMSAHNTDPGNKIPMEPSNIRFGGSESSQHQHVSSPPNRNRYRVAVRKVPSRKFGEVFNSSDVEKSLPATDSIFKHLSSGSSQDDSEVNDSDASTINQSTDTSSTSAYSDEEKDATYSKSLALDNQSDANSPVKVAGASSVDGGKSKEESFSDANLSQPKGTKSKSISRVLRSSRAYKKAKVNLSQSQLDYESQPDIVPDSQAVNES